MRRSLPSFAALLFLSGCSVAGNLLGIAPPETGDEFGEEEVMMFGDYECSDPDCSGHEEGFLLAEEHDYTNIEQCPTEPREVYEGCVTYVELPYEEDMIE